MRRIQAPIHTADNKPVEVGMVVYGFNTGCRVKDNPGGYITRLVVAEVDLSLRRMVRLRKQDGREWRWCAEESRMSCSNEEHLIYASLAAAKKAALPIVKEKIEVYVRDRLERSKSGLSYAIRRHHEATQALEQEQEGQRRAKEECDEMKKSLAEFRRLKAADLEG